MKKYGLIAKMFLLVGVLTLSGCTNSEPTPVKPKEVELVTNDYRKDNYLTSDIFDDFVLNGGLTPTVKMSDSTSLALKKEDFTYSIRNNYSQTISSSEKFDKPGTYSVTVNRKFLEIKTYSINVYDAADYVHVTGIELEPLSLSIVKGNSRQLTPTIYPENATNKALEWTSSNENIVSVNDGLLTAIQPGTTIITVETVDQHKTASCEVTVTSDEVSVSSVSLSDSSKNLNVGESFDLYATVYPKDATNKEVIWKSENESIANVKNGKVTAISKGITRISVITYDKEKTASCIVNVKDSFSPVYETITPMEAIALCDKAGSGVPTDKEYYVKGKVSNVSYNESHDYFEGTFNNSTLVFDSTLSNNVAKSEVDLEGNEIIIFGFIELTNGIYKIGYLPPAISPTGSRYNPKLIEIVSDKPIETVSVTGITVSPITKQIEVGKTATLVANVKPDNATNKRVSWLSSDPTVAIVNNGVVTALSEGNCDISAVTEDQNLTAKCAVEVIPSSGDIPVIGEDYSIEFMKNSRDGSTELDIIGVKRQIYSGSSNIAEITHAGGIFSGTNGLKIGTKSIGGSLTFTPSETIQNANIRKVSLELAQYSKDAAEVKLEIDGEVVSIFTAAEGGGSITFNKEISAKSIRILASKRFYLSKITITCGELIPINPTKIIMDSSLNLSIGEEVDLTLGYEPIDCNKNKEITYSTSNDFIEVIVGKDTNVITIKALAFGTTVLTASLVNLSGISAQCVVTVENIPVTGVVLNKTNVDLRIGSSFQLVPTINPSNATNKDVLWFITDKTIASVSNTGLITGLAVGTTTIKVRTVDGNYTATCEVNVKDKDIDSWTIMLYFCGNDLESDAGLATTDISEILSVRNQPNDVNIIIETGGAKKWSSYYGISSKNITRYHVQSNSLVKDATLPQANMGEYSTFQSFIEWGLNEYPAEKTGVVLWNHGGGMQGVCYDENYYDDSLTNDEVKKALAGAFTKTGQASKLEFIGYDACLMAVQDVAEFNSNYFNYMVCSEEVEAGYGWDYDTWIDDVYTKKSTNTILKAIVDGFISDNGGVNARGYYYQGRYYPADQTLSYLDLSYMNSYKNAFEILANKLKDKISSTNRTQFNSNVMGKVKYFAGSEDYFFFCTFDVKHFLTILSGNSTFNPGDTYINNVLDVFDKLVAYSSSQTEGAKDAHGLSLYYVAGSGYSQSQFCNSTYSNFTNWNYISKTYGGKINSTYSYNK